MASPWICWLLLAGLLLECSSSSPTHEARSPLPPERLVIYLRAPGGRAPQPRNCICDPPISSPPLPNTTPTPIQVNHGSTSQQSSHPNNRDGHDGTRYLLDTMKRFMTTGWAAGGAGSSSEEVGGRYDSGSPEDPCTPLLYSSIGKKRKRFLSTGWSPAGGNQDDKAGKQSIEDTSG